MLYYSIRPIGVPKLETVLIINTGDDALKLESISGSTIHFYCSFFLEKVNFRPNKIRNNCTLTILSFSFQ